MRVGGRVGHLTPAVVGPVAETGLKVLAEGSNGYVVNPPAGIGDGRVGAVAEAQRDALTGVGREIKAQRARTGTGQSVPQVAAVGIGLPQYTIQVVQEDKVDRVCGDLDVSVVPVLLDVPVGINCERDGRCLPRQVNDTVERVVHHVTRGRVSALAGARVVGNSLDLVGQVNAHALIHRVRGCAAKYRADRRLAGLADGDGLASSRVGNHLDRVSPAAG